MTLSFEKLQNLTDLAYLTATPEEMTSLGEEVNAILDFVAQLATVDTQHIAPLFHPMHLTQRGREDEVTEANLAAQLAELAPLFSDDVYLVPKFIESES